MFGMLEAMLSLLRRQVGLRTDAAGANGSLHGKIADIATNKVQDIKDEVGTRQKPRGVAGAPGSFTTTQTIMQTALNITNARGRLVALAVRTSGVGNTVLLNLIIDGITVRASASGSSSVAMSSISLPVGGFFLGFDPAFLPAEQGGDTRVYVHFKNSLRLVVRSNSGQTVTVWWLYELE